MANSDQLIWLGVIGGGYLILKETTDFLTKVPDWVKEDAKQVNEDLKMERDEDNISDETLNRHIVSAREKYRRHYLECDGQEGRSLEELDRQIQSKDLTLEEEAWSYKQAADSMITKCREEKSGPGINLPINKLIAAGLTLAAINSGRLGNFGKWAYDKLRNGENNGSENEDEVTEALSYDPNLSDLNSSSASPVYDNIVAEPEPLDTITLEPPPDTSGEVVAEGSVDGILSSLPDWIEKGAKQIIEFGIGGSIIITQGTLEILADVTGESIEFFVNNPDVALVVTLAIIVLIGGAITSGPTFGLSNALSSKIAVAMVSTVGVSISIQRARQRDDIRETVQISN
jgi:hypothetical protein